MQQLLLYTLCWRQSASLFKQTRQVADCTCNEVVVSRLQRVCEQNTDKWRQHGLQHSLFGAQGRQQDAEG